MIYQIICFYIKNLKIWKKEIKMKQERNLFIDLLNKNDNIELMLKQIKVLKKDFVKNENFIKLNILLITKELSKINLEAENERKK